jgi:hypothetical protein
VSFDTAYLDAAHEHCFGNEPEVRASEQACCIACARPFQARLATETIRQQGWDHPTVFCPVCAFDTILGDSSGYPTADVTFIAEMNKQYFKEPLGSEQAWKELLNAQD